MRQIKFNKDLLNQIAHHLFLAFTDQQIAFIVGISERSYFRLKASPEWQQIKAAEFAREAVMRQRVWNGDPGWQGAAWMLERKYASQLSKPEVQLNLNTGNTTNNTIVITAEQASGLRSRASAIESELTKLTPPNQRNVQVSDKLGPAPEERLRLGKADQPASHNINLKRSELVSSEAHSPPPTPGQKPTQFLPSLSGKSQLSELSSNSKVTPVDGVSVSSGSGGLKKKPGRPKGRRTKEEILREAVREAAIQKKKVRGVRRAARELKAAIRNQKAGGQST